MKLQIFELCYLETLTVDSFAKYSPVREDTLRRKLLGRYNCINL